MDGVIQSLIAGIGGGSPILFLLWGYLKDLRREQKESAKKLRDIELEIAEKNYDLKLEFLDKSFERTIRGLETSIKTVDNKIGLLDASVTAVWKNIDKLKDKGKQ